MQDFLNPVAERTRLWPDALRRFCCSLSDEQWQQLCIQAAFEASKVEQQNLTPVMLQFLSVFRQLAYLSAEISAQSNVSQSLLAEHIMLLFQLNLILPESKESEQFKNLFNDVPDTANHFLIPRYLLNCWITPFLNFLASAFGLTFILPTEPGAVDYDAQWVKLHLPEWKNILVEKLILEKKLDKILLDDLSVELIFSFFQNIDKEHDDFYPDIQAEQTFDIFAGRGFNRKDSSAVPREQWMEWSLARRVLLNWVSEKRKHTPELTSLIERQLQKDIALRHYLSFPNQENLSEKLQQNDILILSALEAGRNLSYSLNHVEKKLDRTYNDLIDENIDFKDRISSKTDDYVKKDHILPALLKEQAKNLDIQPVLAFVHEKLTNFFILWDRDVMINPATQKKLDELDIPFEMRLYFAMKKIHSYVMPKDENAASSEDLMPKVESLGHAHNNHKFFLQPIIFTEDDDNERQQELKDFLKFESLEQFLQHNNSSYLKQYSKDRARYLQMAENFESTFLSLQENLKKWDDVLKTQGDTKQAPEALAEEIEKQGQTISEMRKELKSLQKTNDINAYIQNKLFESNNQLRNFLSASFGNMLSELNKATIQNGSETQRERLSETIKAINPSLPDDVINRYKKEEIPLIFVAILSSRELQELLAEKSDEAERLAICNNLSLYPVDTEKNPYEIYANVLLLHSERIAMDAISQARPGSPEEPMSDVVPNSPVSGYDSLSGVASPASCSEADSKLSASSSEVSASSSEDYVPRKPGK